MSRWKGIIAATISAALVAGSGISPTGFIADIGNTRETGGTNRMSQKAKRKRAKWG
ncbi:hypothetical protein ACJJIE_00170 (plasmid) [Microbulbifer sp. TRSA001]|uniref:hypothetical protein n=1 Tax=Microbulbifer sp. TRSA001 TaxID=3243381 RepID=UPI0040393D72